MNNLTAWAEVWNIPQEALNDLMRRMVQPEVIDQTVKPATSETGVAQRHRLQFVAKTNGMLWRNNVGALKDENGRMIRYGLANESKQMNENVKSSDYIGLQPVIITPEMIGRLIGQFVAYETKAPGWIYSGTEREVAQLAYHRLVLAKGGAAGFITS